MPTVVVMDVSLSMTRPVSVEGSEEYQRKHLAVHGLTMLFEHMATNYKLEFTALVVFSSLWELMVPFTRDYNTLQVGCAEHQSSKLSTHKKPPPTKHKQNTHAQNPTKQKDNKAKSQPSNPPTCFRMTLKLCDFLSSSAERLELSVLSLF